ncbi:MAG: hypothetical protein ACI4AA_01720 [Lachnospiraceae bacterium]
MKNDKIERIEKEIRPEWQVTVLFTAFFVILGILDHILDCILPFII